MEEGFIKLSRKILEWRWYKNLNTKHLFEHMLIMANFKEGKYEGKIIPRGSFVSSIRRLSEETGLTSDEVRTALGHLVDTNEITKQSFSKFTVFTVVNYAKYQDSPKQITNQFPSYSQAIPKHIEEGKEVNNINNNIYSDDDGVNIYSRAHEEAGKLIVKYWGRQPTEVDVEHVRGLIIVFDVDSVKVSEDRVEILEYAFNCSASANALNWNYIFGVIYRLGARGINTLDEAYSFDIKRENGGNGYE